MNEVWSINDLISKYVYEEEKLKKERSESVLFTTHSKPCFHKIFGKPEKVKSNAPKKIQYNRGQDSD